MLKSKNKLPNNPGVYELKEPASGMTYLGATKNIKKRMSEHIAKLNSNTHPNLNLQEVFNISNEISISFEICQTREEALEKEQKLLDERFNDFNNLNSSSLSRGNFHSEESKAKISAANKGKTYGKGHSVSEEEREKTRLRSLGNTWCLGRKLSDESKAKISEKRKGIIFTDDHKEKLSNAKTFPVLINGKEFKNATQAAKELGLSKRQVTHRVNSPNFLDWKRKSESN